MSRSSNSRHPCFGWPFTSGLHSSSTKRERRSRCYNGSAAVPRVYLDTVITSGFVEKDLVPADEMAAVEQIYALHNDGLIKIVTSKMSRIEQERTADIA